MTNYRTGAIYIRVSTSKQDELSPDAQRRLLLEYAGKNNILIDSNYIFIEDGISGKKADKRPEFQKMIACAKNKEFDIILVWKFSRFARNQEESIVYKSLLKKNNVDVFSVSEPLVDGPFGSLIERIIEWMDEYYSIRLSGEVMRGMTEKAMRGGFQAKPPFGYKSVPGNPVPEVVPEEAAVVKRIFEMYLNGSSSFDISKDLTSTGIVTRNGNSFKRATIDYMLTNVFYCGIVRWNVRGGTGKRTRKDENEWITALGQHTPIIDKDTFNKVQEKYRERKLNTLHYQKPASSYAHYLSGLIKCSSCGSTLVSSRGKNTNGKFYGSFNCNNYNKGGCLVSHAVSHLKAEAAIKKSLVEFSAPNVNVTFEKIPATNPLLDTTFLKSKIAKLEDKEKRFKDAYANGIDSLDEYKLNKQLVAIEREKLTTELKELQERNKITKSDVTLMKKRASDILDIINSDNYSVLEKNNALKSIIKKIVFEKKNKKFIVYYYLK